MIIRDDEEVIFNDLNKFMGVRGLAKALMLVYKYLYFQKWDCTIPDPKTFGTKEFLYSLDDEHVIFHKSHEKFGRDILEYGDSRYENLFCFFDYSSLMGVFKWHEEANDDDIHDACDRAPPVPTYYAHPSDRHNYNDIRENWERK